jgi:cyanate permease
MPVAVALGALACPLLVNRSLAWSGGLGPAAWVAAGAALLVAVVLLRRDEPAPGAHEEAEGRAPAPRRLLLVISVFFGDFSANKASMTFMAAAPESTRLHRITQNTIRKLPLTRVRSPGLKIGAVDF